MRGFLKPGDQLPSVRKLAAELAMNPATIVKAYDLLQEELLLVRQQGKGAFIADGNSALRSKASRHKLRELASQLALEGRRVGLDEDQIETLLRAELKKLQPGVKAKKGRSK
ncbi:MAG: GntR family transcriptional regulator [Phycisphaeraceae bacterium]|nr:GntR family transcriptional regulator [Phycisphaeraceae bacterium]